MEDGNENLFCQKFLKIFAWFPHNMHFPCILKNVFFFFFFFFGIKINPDYSFHFLQTFEVSLCMYFHHSRDYKPIFFFLNKNVLF